MPEVGRFYTRNQINEMHGGGVHDYLPVVDGKIVYACLKKEMNPFAPNEIFVGSNGTDCDRSFLVNYNSPIPVYINENLSNWEYLGLYRIRGFTNNKLVVEEARYTSERDNITCVVYLEKIR